MSSGGLTFFSLHLFTCHLFLLYHLLRPFSALVLFFGHLSAAVATEPPELGERTKDLRRGFLGSPLSRRLSQKLLVPLLLDPPPSPVLCASPRRDGLTPGAGRVGGPPDSACTSSFCLCLQLNCRPSQL